MKKLWIASAILVATALTISSCLKSDDDTPACTPQDPSVETPILDSFITAKNFYEDSLDVNGQPAPIKDTLGIQYQIVDPGSATDTFKYTTDNFVVSYLGKIIRTDVTFASSTSASGVLGSAPNWAWYLILPKIGAGGHVKIFTPSYFAYGCQGFSTVPGNASLYYDIKLTSISR